jgi:hypothetical protein
MWYIKLMIISSCTAIAMGSSHLVWADTLGDPSQLETRSELPSVSYHYWPTGQGDNSIWVQPAKSQAIIPGETYRLHLDSDKALPDPFWASKQSSKIELMSW